MEPNRDIVDTILKDHIPLKKRILILKDPALGKSQKRPTYDEFSRLLISHAKTEEKSLYKAMRDFEKLRIESYEASTEHAIAEHLLREVSAARDDNEWLAKVKVVAETVEHHIEVEEHYILVNVKREMDENTRHEICEQYLRLKRE